jgi:hypothetical protein
MYLPDMRHGHSPFALAVLVLLSGCSANAITGSPPLSAVVADAWAEFSVRPSLARRITDTTVLVGDLQPVGGAGEGSEHWLRKTTTFFGGARRIQWTDTRSCAAARPILSKMDALEMPRPIEGGGIELRADGVLYALSTDGRYASGELARLSVSSSGGTPLADWAERALVELEPCWSDLPPDELRRGSGADGR